MQPPEQPPEQPLVGWGLEAGGWRLGAGGWRPLPFYFGGGFWGRLLGAACGLPLAARLLAAGYHSAGCWLPFCWLLATILLAAGLLAGHRFVRWASFPSDRLPPLRWRATLV